MVQNDRKRLLQQTASERMAVELKAMVELHKNMGRMYKKHGLELAEYVENEQAGLYRNYYLEIKGVSE